MKSGRIDPCSLKFVHSYKSAPTPGVLEYWRDDKKRLYGRHIVHFDRDGSLCCREGPQSKLTKKYKDVTCKRCLTIIKNPKKMKRMSKNA